MSANDEELAAKLYDAPGMYKSSLADGFNRLRDASGMSAEDADTWSAALAEDFASGGIPTTEAQRLHAQIVRRQINPPTEDDIFEWETETRRTMRERYGAKAEDNLATVREFIAERPALWTLLERTGLTMHPETVLGLVERANTLAAQNRAVAQPKVSRTADGRFASDKEQSMVDRFYGKAE